MEQKDNDTPTWRPLWILAGVLVSIWIVYGVVVWHAYKGDDRGLFGDMFGGLNALFSALAFAALIYTADLQRKELECQRKELKQTREAMEASAAAQTRIRRNSPKGYADPSNEFSPSSP